MVTNRKKICLNYLKTELVIDILALLALFFGGGLTGDNFFLILTMLKLINFKFNVNRLDDYFNIRFKYRLMFDLLNLIGTLLLFVHIFAMLWHGLGLLEIYMGIDKNWLTASDHYIQGET